VDEERSRFLNERLGRLAEEQPRILLLRDKLLQIGGTHLVAPAEPEPDLEDILLRGQVIEGDVRFERWQKTRVIGMWLHFGDKKRVH